MIIFLNIERILAKQWCKTKKKKKNMQKPLKALCNYKYKSYKYKTMLIGNLRNIIQRMMKYYFSNMTFSNNKEIK